MGFWKERYADGFKHVVLESIDHQLRKKIDGLAEAIGKFRAAGDYSPAAYSKSDIATYIKDTFGVSVALKNSSEVGVPTEMLFAAVQPPNLDKNHTLIPNFRRVVANSNDLLQHSKFTRDRSVVGFVDRANAKIIGAFSDILCPLYISSGLFKNADFLDIEIAAIIGHEIGHIFTYFEKLTDTVVTNMVAAAAANKLMGLDSPKDRIKVVHEVEKHTGQKIEDAETIANAADKGTAYTHVVVEIEKARQNDMGSEAYANRSWERLADDFSSRLGCGPELASGLIKISKHDPWFLQDRGFVSMPVHVAMETASIAALVVGMIGAPVPTAIMHILAFLAMDPQYRIYDRPEERLQAIRNTMVDELKLVKKGEAREKVLANLAKLDAMMEDIEDKYTVLEMVHLYVTPSGRKDRKAIQFHQELESYIYNNLFTASAKLKQRA